MRSIILGFVLLLTITACQKQSFVPNYNKAAKLAAQLQEIYDHGELPAFAVAIVTKDSIPFQQAYRYADAVEGVFCVLDDYIIFIIH
ncbi:MAG: hypothetical protein AAF849_23305 [Bacteroidota bacterium]